MSLQIDRQRRFQSALGRLVLALLACTAGSCTALEQQIQDLDERLQQHIQSSEEKLAEQNAALARLQTDHNQLIRAVRCPNPNVRQFVDFCVTQSQYNCTANDLNDAVKAMVHIDHSIAYLRPTETELDSVRVAELKRMYGAHVRFSTTRLLVLVLPAGESPTYEVQAEKIAERLRRKLIDEDFPAVESEKKSSVGPLKSIQFKPLKCKERNSLLGNYRSALPKRDIEVGNEPKGTQPRIVLWFFLLDC